ncbi:oxoglutarate-dependent flavonoid 7-O-demethylase 1-like [Bidens hawaiensis]|uniref:oxoglutarate-dependent flavonoid 7-O-demethylase 1-like n=1 Tax=Bidens hawaiensis TaxID=980011 RepID=UPI00404A0C51
MVFSKSQGNVQELAKELKLEVPHCYVQEHREPTFVSNSRSPLFSIPLVDMNDIIKILGSNDKDQLKNLCTTCQEWGIFQLVNHGVDKMLVKKMKEEVVKFFNTPAEQKLKYKLMPGDHQGYGQTPVHSQDQKIDWADRFYMITNPVHRRKSNLLPEFPTTLRCSNYQFHCLYSLFSCTCLCMYSHIMSNGVYNSIEDRATVNSVKERISLAMFFNPKLESDVGPAKSLLTNTGNPPLYKTLVTEQYLKDFFSRKLNGKAFLEKIKIKNGET